VPLLPIVGLGLIAPGFVAPLFDDRLRLAGLPVAVLYLLLPLLNLLVARVTRNDDLTALAIAITSFVGLFFGILGPAFVLIAINLAIDPGPTDEVYRVL
jgi:hypothetical protein